MSVRQKLDDIGESEEIEGRETKQRATSVKIFSRGKKGTSIGVFRIIFQQS